VPLNSYQRFAYRTFGKAVASTAKTNTHLRITLQRAHINVRPEVYLSYSYLNMTVSFLSTLALVLFLATARLAGIIVVPAELFAVLIPMPFLLAAVIYLTTFLLPDIRAGTRARDIDAKLPYALNYIAIMASAGITIDRIFASLAKQPVYGEISSEAAWISRDLDLLGRDVIGALTAAIDRSPSLKFQDFLQGAIINITSGGDMKNYFRAKSDQYAYESRQDQKKFLDNLGVLAESFVTVVVAAPLFILVLLSVMTMFGSSGGSALTIGYTMILALLPLAQAGFVMTIKAITLEP
jgi:archaeal flagellar protein FlaJ